MADTRQPLVVFSPSGKRGRFPEGTPVLQAARSLGVDLDSVCGGRALCGRCQVTVAEGTLSKHGIVSHRDNLSAAADAEAHFAARRGLAAGRRLGCQARIVGDVAIDVPESSQVHRQVVRKPFEAHDIEINPVTHAYCVDVGAPDMNGRGGDVERLLEALRRDWQLDQLRVGLTVIRDLQQALRENGRQVTVAVRGGDEIIAVWPGFRGKLYGAAVDIGSTTLAAHLCDLASGEVVASAGRMNPQIRFGEDLMSRVSYVMMNPGGDADLTQAVRDALDGLFADVAHDAGIELDEIVEITIVGNPIMLSLAKSLVER